MSIEVKIIRGCEKNVHSGGLEFLHPDDLGIKLRKLEEEGGEVISVATIPSVYVAQVVNAVDYLVTYRK